MLTTKSLYIGPVSPLVQCNAQHAQFGQYKVVISKNWKFIKQNNKI